MILPDALNSARSLAVLVPATLTDTDWPVASFIWLATVRFHTRSYRRSSSLFRPAADACRGVRNRSPAGRIASCASWAFFTLLT